MLKTDTEEKKLLNKVIIFVFFAHKIYPSESWMCCKVRNLLDLLTNISIWWTKVLQVWNNMTRLWQNFHFWENYTFNFYQLEIHCVPQLRLTALAESSLFCVFEGWRLGPSPQLTAPGLEWMTLHTTGERAELYWKQLNSLQPYSISNSAMTWTITLSLPGEHRKREQAVTKS